MPESQELPQELALESVKKEALCSSEGQSPDMVATEEFPACKNKQPLIMK
jgi:hypothetical protein